MTVTSYLPLLAAATGALIGALLTRALNRRKEQRQTTLDLFNHYHSAEMQKSRRGAWVYLKGVYAADPRPFSQLFSDRAEGEHRGQYQDLSNVLYFWYMVWMLNDEKALNETLAVKMFAYQYDHWRDGFERLHDVTKEAGETPEWLPVMDEKKMKWLIDRPRKLPLRRRAARKDRG